ncbi:MAG: alpha/beta hydrolase [Pseudomonadota bacterium]
MTIAFVHGVPETADIWTALRGHMSEETVTISPPGFGAPVPDGFGCTTDDYLAWMIEEVAALPGPVDLIGHDWGGLHTLRLAMARPDLIRCWISDVVGLLDPAYKWHDLAQSWQTPEMGEQVVGMMAAAPAKVKAAQLVGASMPEETALAVAEMMNENMAKAILPLYRSAAQPRMAELGEDLSKVGTMPGLAIVAEKDAYTGGDELALRAAARAGAEVARLPGLGHWWMCQEPKKGAELIEAFLAKVRS